MASEARARKRPVRRVPRKTPRPRRPVPPISRAMALRMRTLLIRCHQLLLLRGSSLDVPGPHRRQMLVLAHAIAAALRQIDGL